MNKDLLYIDEHYGSDMGDICNTLFPILLSKPGLLPKILRTHFSDNQSLLKDIKDQNKLEDFKNFINYRASAYIESEQKSAEQLMEEAGYNLDKECVTTKQFYEFKKYYRKGEEPRINANKERIWFAAKKDIDDIKHSTVNDREIYAKSLLAIRFSNNNSTSLSIYNRYGEYLSVPANLNSIASGLTNAFVRDYGLREAYSYNEYLSGYNRFSLDGYLDVKNTFYKVNTITPISDDEILYYCDNNIVIKEYPQDGIIKRSVKQLPSNLLLIDYFIFDIDNKKITLVDDRLQDEFISNIGCIKKIIYTYKSIVIERENSSQIEIGINDNKAITYLRYPCLKSINNQFLPHNTSLEVIDLPNLENANIFLPANSKLKEINLPKLKQCKYFLPKNKQLTKIFLPSLELCGVFLPSNQILNEVYLPKLKKCGQFLENNEELDELILPELVTCGSNFLRNNRKLNKLYLNVLEVCGNDFLQKNSSLIVLSLPSLQSCGHDFLYENKSLRELYLPKLKETKGIILPRNRNIKKIDLSSLDQEEKTSLTDLWQSYRKK